MFDYNIVPRKKQSGPPTTFILIAACVAVFVLQILLYPVIDIYFGFIPKYATARPWTFVTAIFLHGGFSHLFVNMFVLFMFGIFLENRIGRNIYLLIFFLAGIVGNISYMLITPNSTTIGLGASGAIYGLMGALVVLLPFMVVYIWGLVPMPLLFVAVLWALGDIFGLFTPADNIGHEAHLAGLVIGLLFGFYLRQQAKRKYKQYRILGF
jgi:hypothetical protein